jgi:hypothetical protein
LDFNLFPSVGDVDIADLNNDGTPPSVVCFLAFEYAE